MLEQLTFEEIKFIWEKELWPNKKNGVQKANEWTWVSGHVVLGKNKNMIAKVEPIFYGIREDNKIVAVNSVYRSNENNWRSRGLWVYPEYRRCGHATTLLGWAQLHTKTFGGDYLWTVPRKSALPAYEKVGFNKCSEWFDDGQYGPNCIANYML